MLLLVETFIWCFSPPLFTISDHIACIICAVLCETVFSISTSLKAVMIRTVRCDFLFVKLDLKKKKKLFHS